MPSIHSYFRNEIRLNAESNQTPTTNQLIAAEMRMNYVLAGESNAALV